MLKQLFKSKKNRASASDLVLVFQKLEPRQLLAVTDLTVVTYNALNFGTNSVDRQDEFSIVFGELNADVVVMQEITSEVGADLLLNAINSNGQSYARADFVNGNDSDHILFYNTFKVDLVGQNYIPTTLREIGEYTLSVDGTQFNIYSAHLKASSGGTNEQRRLDEVTVLRNHLETLPSDMEFIVAGDMNIYGSSEPAYQKLIASESNNTGRLVDLLPAEFIGEWHDNVSFASVHTQSPRTVSFGGGATGGMDDRFDMIFANFDINDGLGLEFVPNSYFALGNDGEHFNLSILDGSNDSASPTVIQALHDASDHLPVVATFQVITDSVAGITVTETSGSTDVSENGDMDFYEIVLDSVPQDDVVINITPDSQLDLGNGAGNSVTVAFSPANALTPQLITVAALDDTEIEGAHSAMVQHVVSSNDSNYDGLSITDIDVNITDNDEVPSLFLLNEIYVNNPGRDANYEYIEILASPSTPLTDIWLLEVEGDGKNAGKIDNAQNLSGLVSGSNGLLLLGQDYGTAGTPWGNQVNPATTVADLSGGFMENGTVTFLLVSGFIGNNNDDLDTNNDGQFDVLPWESVLDSVGWSDGGTSDQTYSPARLSQTGVPDAATRFREDQVPENSNAWFNGDITGSANSTVYGSGSNNLPVGAVITPGETNFEVSPPSPGVTVVESGGNTTMEEGGVGDSWTVVLDSVPTATVIIDIDPDAQIDLGQGAGIPIQLTFSPEDALIPKTILAEAADDLIAEDTHLGFVVQTVNSADPNYDGIALSDIEASISDNDIAGVIIAESGDSTDVEEGGSIDTYTVALNSKPTDLVTITVSPDSQLDIGNGIGASIELFFSPENATIPQTITVRASDDSIIEGFHTGLITHSAASQDLVYQGINISSVTAKITDNDATNSGTKFFVVDQSVNQTFEYADDGSLVENYGLVGDNSSARGVTTDAAGTKVWVIDNNDQVYVYDANGLPLGQWFAAGLSGPEGIATDDSDLWIVDRRLDRVLYYSGGASITAGNFSATSSFALANGNRNPQGITTDGNSIWVVDAAGKKDRVFKYSITGNLLGNWQLPNNNSNPAGITIDPNNVNDIWIVDRGNQQVFQYFDAAHRTSGSPQSNATWALAAGNTNPRGIADPLAILGLETTDSGQTTTFDLSLETTLFFFNEEARNITTENNRVSGLPEKEIPKNKGKSGTHSFQRSRETHHLGWSILDELFAKGQASQQTRSSETIEPMDGLFDTLALDNQID